MLASASAISGGSRMADTARHDSWQAGDSYDAYMGRWSRRLAPRFVDWLGLPKGLDWLEIGCGTGALSAAILAGADPKSLTAIDASPGFVERARANVADARARFELGDALALAQPPASRDAVVSALFLNFVPDPAKALAEKKRVARPGGTVAFYVWDYPAGGVGFMRAFWDAAAALDPAAAELSERRRFPFCTPDGLAGLAAAAGLADAVAAPLETPTLFADFDDLWRPFTLGTGPAPGYCASLAPAAREALKQRLRDSLPIQPDGSIPLTARAWALRARAP